VRARSRTPPPLSFSISAAAELPDSYDTTFELVKSYATGFAVARSVDIAGLPEKRTKKIFFSPTVAAVRASPPVV
jgi:hypothetical protein